MKRPPFPLRWALLAVLLAALPGCLVAAAGAGAAAGIYLTDQGASSSVAGSLEEVERRTREVLEELDVRVSERTERPTGRRYEGVAGDLEVNVELEQEGSGTTLVKASARRNRVQYDREYARALVRRVIQQP